MPRIQSLNILLDPTGKAYLKELYGKVIENVQKQTISGALKNRDLSGDPTSGTVEANRYQNSASKRYGSARTAGKGDAIVAKPVVIQIDQDREIIEELEEKDVKLYGVDGVLDRRSINHVNSMVRELEEAFFLEAANAGEIEFEPVASEIAAQLEEQIVAVEKIRNNYVNGVPRNIMSIVLDTEMYSQIRSYLDTNVHNANVNTAVEGFGYFHGVKVYSTVYLPAGVKGMLLVDGAVAQPVTSNTYGAEKIPLSDAYAVELFYYFGTKAVTPDLISVWKKVLAKPTISITTGTLTITGVENAEAYRVYAKVSGAAKFLVCETKELTVDLTDYSELVDDTTYTITVEAVNMADAYKATESEGASYTVA